MITRQANLVTFSVCMSEHQKTTGLAHFQCAVQYDQLGSVGCTVGLCAALVPKAAPCSLWPALPHLASWLLVTILLVSASTCTTILDPTAK